MCCNKKDLLFVRPLGADEAVAAATNNWSTGNQPQHKLFSPSPQPNRTAPPPLPTPLYNKDFSEHGYAPS